MESDCSISTKVFRKDTHTDQYLNFSSSHPLEHETGVVKTLMNKADRLVSEKTELGREKDHIRQALKVNGYPDWMLLDSQLSDQWDTERKRRSMGERGRMRRKK